MAHTQDQVSVPVELVLPIARENRNQALNQVEVLQAAYDNLQQTARRTIEQLNDEIISLRGQLAEAQAPPEG